MRNKYLAIQFIILFILLPINQRCKNFTEKEIIFDSFHIEKNLISIEADWIINNDGLRMQIFDSILLVFDELNEHFFYFYNLNNHKLLASFGKKGKGPNEFVRPPEVLGSFRSENNEIYFFLNDQFQNEMVEVKLLESINSRRIVTQETFNLSYKLPIRILTRINDSIFAGTGNDKRGSLFLYNYKQDSIINWQKRVKTKGFGYIHKDNEFIINQEYIKVRPDKQKIVGIFHSLKRIHIYNPEGDIETIIIDKDQGDLDFSSEKALFNNIKYYYPSILSDKYILIVNTLSTGKDWGKDQSKIEILIFDYSGKAVANYKLDRWVLGYTMDWKLNRLYAYDLNNDKFVYYNLTGLR